MHYNKSNKRKPELDTLEFHYHCLYLVGKVLSPVLKRYVQIVKYRMHD